MYPDPVFLWALLEICSTPNSYLFSNNTLSDIEFFRRNTLKKNREIKAHPVCLFGLSTLRRNETRIFNPQKVRPGARLSKAPATFRARQATFSSPVYKNVEVYAPETSCRKRKPIAF